MKVKSKLILAFSIWEILITWTIMSTLDYFFKRFGRRIQLKVKWHLLLWLYQVFIWIGLFYINTYKDSKILSKLLDLSMMVKQTLKGHRQLHVWKRLERKSCPICYIVTKNKGFLKTFVSNPKLYPPFKFSKKSRGI